MEWWIWFSWWIFFYPCIQDYFEYIIKKKEHFVNNPPFQIYVNKIESHIAFKINTSYKLELLSKKKVNNAEKIGINPKKLLLKQLFKKQQKPQEIWLEITSGSKSKVKEKKGRWNKWNLYITRKTSTDYWCFKTFLGVV